MTTILRQTAVYTEYDEKTVPPHPGPLWTRFICLSDTHSRTCFVPPGDVLLHGGDLTSWGYASQVMNAISWLGTLSHPHKILMLGPSVVAGNHDLCLDPKFVVDLEQLQDWRVDAHPAVAGVGPPTSIPEAFRKICAAEGLVYLENEFYTFTTSAGRTWNVWGSPCSPLHAGNGFQYHSYEADAIYSAVPEQTDILITHAPPHGILDKTRRGKRAGCEGLARRLHNLDKHSLESLSEASRVVRLHVFGHIHEARGARTDTLWGQVERVSVNAAVGRSRRLPIIVDLLN